MPHLPDDHDFARPLKVLRRRINGVYREDLGFSGPTRRYVLMVAMLVGLASVPTLAILTTGSSEITGDGRTGAMDVPFLPPAGTGPVRPAPFPPASGIPSAPVTAKTTQGYGESPRPTDSPAPVTTSGSPSVGDSVDPAGPAPGASPDDVRPDSPGAPDGGKAHPAPAEPPQTSPRDSGGPPRAPDRDPGGLPRAPDRDHGGPPPASDSDSGGPPRAPHRDAGGPSSGPRRDPGGRSGVPQPGSGGPSQASRRASSGSPRAAGDVGRRSVPRDGWPLARRSIPAVPDLPAGREEDPIPEPVIPDDFPAVPDLPDIPDEHGQPADDGTDDSGNSEEPHEPDFPGKRLCEKATTTPERPDRRHSDRAATTQRPTGDPPRRDDQSTVHDRRSTDRSRVSRRSAVAERPYNIRPSRIREQSHSDGNLNVVRRLLTESSSEENRRANRPYRGTHRAEHTNYPEERSASYDRSTRVGRHHAEPNPDAHYINRR